MYYFYSVVSMCIVYYVYWSSGFVQSKLLKKKKLNLVKLINLYVLGVFFFYRLVVFKVDIELSGIWGMFFLWSSIGRKIELEIIFSIFNQSQMFIIFEQDIKICNCILIYDFVFFKNV